MNNKSHASHVDAPSVFEFQLMPPLVYILQQTNVKADNVEFSTVIVYSCSNSCWNGDREEVDSKKKLYL